MYSLLCEAKFWTLKNDIRIRSTDFGALRYYDKKELDECPYQEGKKSYCYQRGTNFVLRNKRPLKLKNNLKELEQQLYNNKIVFYDWKDDNILNIILNTGLIVAIGVNVYSKDIYKITFDRFLIGKLLSENICNVLCTKSHLIISYNENQLTIINYSKPCTKSNLPQKLAKLEPKIQLVDLCGPTGRRLDRNLSCNKSGDMILTWWHSTRNEVYPWSPLVKDEDRANVHVYTLVGTKIELICYYRTEFDLTSVNFSKIKPNLIQLIEQKVSKKGEVVVEYSSYEVCKKVLRKISITSIPLQTQICCHSISPDEEKLLLGCIDGSLVLFDEPKGVTRLVKTAFIPNIVSWHNDGALIIIANERSQFQIFDFALSCLRSQLLNDDMIPSNILDLSSYFKIQPTLLCIKWNKKSDATCTPERYVSSDGLLLLIFESGPLGILNLIGGGGLLNDVQNCGLTPDTIIREYLLWNQCDKALNLLLCLNWNTCGSVCLAGLYHIANHIFKQPFTPEKEIQLEAALGSFYSPARPLTKFTENEFGDQIHDLTRRFFHLLLRYRLYEKAYCLAIDLSNPDLFVDLYHCAKFLEDDEMAFTCKAKVEEFTSLSETTSHSSCSHSSCSCSGIHTDNEDDEDAILPPLPQVSVKKSKACRVPPLPDLNRQNKLRGSAFFNCTSMYLKPQSTNNALEKNSEDLPKEAELQAASTSFSEFYPSLLNHASQSLCHNYSTSQILTPEFSHPYEIRTSFSGEEIKTNNFMPIEPAAQKAADGKSSKNPNSLNPRPSTLSVFESLCDIPSLIKNSTKQEDVSKKDYSQYRSDPCLNNFGPLKFKSIQQPKPNQYVPNNFNSFGGSRTNSFDYLLSSPIGHRPPMYNGDKQGIRMNQITNSNYYAPRNFNPAVECRPSSYLPSFRNYNNENNLFQRPLKFVPNPYPKQVVKPPNPSSSKQKVKFSDTVTHIVVPDISKISIEDETQSQHKTKVMKTPKPSICFAAVKTNDSEASYNEDNNYSTDPVLQKEQNDDEENNETIKVIHFGVV